ncbi:vWA domain-containing protein [Sphingomonas sp. 10B4]|uniref:vWA domain-containing protein n=1 Tax=Sphingomonas sp. 10B4 TaxID=3048575 RepID=UPI002AB463CD|nr:VWA domain-containing protein [Sphingomonas sp. 10B4]MDY7524633.1 VWA domain-containing protein [Sphingomonas sp. 10B4]MEB0282412.1 VWA domain-containing protein [Sphingomonas sp. 10B4]
MPFGDDVAPGGFDLIEFADNPEPRCACVLLLDVSGSMNGVSLIALNAGLQQFAKDVRADSLAARRVDLAAVTFGDSVNVVAEFGSAQHFYPQPLTAKGSTPMGEAINVSLDLMANRQQQYRSAGITPYRGVIFLVTDGKPTDSWERAARRIEEGERRKSFSFFAVGVDDADIDTLAKISVSAPVMLRETDFAAMFRWLSSSLSAVSRSSTGQTVNLTNPAGPAGWASIV